MSSSVEIQDPSCNRRTVKWTSLISQDTEVWAVSLPSAKDFICLWNSFLPGQESPVFSPVSSRSQVTESNLFEARAVQSVCRGFITWVNLLLPQIIIWTFNCAANHGVADPWPTRAEWPARFIIFSNCPRESDSSWSLRVTPSRPVSHGRHAASLLSRRPCRLQKRETWSCSTG